MGASALTVYCYLLFEKPRSHVLSTILEIILGVLGTGGGIYFHFLDWDIPDKDNEGGYLFKGQTVLGSLCALALAMQSVLILTPKNYGI